MAMAIIALVRPGPSTATSTSASSSEGKARITSITRMMTVSTQPPKNPASRPEDDPADQRDRHDDDADEQRILRAIDQPRQHVPPDGIGAEQECRTDRPPASRRHQQGVAILHASDHAVPAAARRPPSAPAKMKTHRPPPRRGSGGNRTRTRQASGVGSRHR
jgi:hypothetical protein